MDWTARHRLIESRICWKADEFQRLAAIHHTMDQNGIIPVSPFGQCLSGQNSMICLFHRSEIIVNKTLPGCIFVIVSRMSDINATQITSASAHSDPSQPGLIFASSGARGAASAGLSVTGTSVCFSSGFAACVGPGVVPSVVPGGVGLAWAPNFGFGIGLILILVKRRAPLECLVVRIMPGIMALFIKRQRVVKGGLI